MVEPTRETANENSNTIIAQPDDFRRLFLVEIYRNAHRLFFLLVVAAILSIGAVMFLPKTYVIEATVQRAAAPEYSAATNLLFPNGAADAADASAMVDDVIRQVVADPSIFAEAYDKSHGTSSDHNALNLFDKTVTETPLAPVRGQEKDFVPGYKLKIVGQDAHVVEEFTSSYTELLKKNSQEELASQLSHMLGVELARREIDFEVAAEKFNVQSDVSAGILEDSIEVARAGDIAKPIISQDMPLSASIPVEQAVPQYFFGVDVLEKRREVALRNKDVLMRVPGYSDYISNKLRLGKYGEFIKKLDFDVLYVNRWVLAKQKIGVVSRIAIAVGVTVLVLVVAMLFMGYRVGRKVFLSTETTVDKRL